MSRPKLLLADDSMTIQKVVNLTFGDLGMDVSTFSDGESAIQHFDEIKPDIVLADVHMPGIGGYRLCELVRSGESGRNTPVLLLVGSFEPFDQEEATRVGADGHITKPFSSIADLISTVEGLVKQSAGAEQPSEEPASDGPRPDTTDIDSLYEKSFAETVEIPRNGSTESTYEFAELDDEMIQTSYAGQDDDAPETLYAVDELEENSLNAGEIDTAEPESLIAESMPSESPIDQPVPEYPNAEQEQTGPFDSVAAEPPPSFSALDSPLREEIKIAMDDTDLLELPAASSLPQKSPDITGERPASGLDPQDLSPELIDLLVEKVVERLEQRAKTGAAHSVSGN